MLILASTSPFRQAILNNLRLPFTTARPEVDETPLAGEDAPTLVQRLARAKALAVPADPADFVLGSDQVATLDGEILGKPHTVANAEAQLTKFSGRAVTFYTGLAVRHGAECHVVVEPFTVHFRPLSAEVIRHYVAVEQPLQCAGAFRSEGLGILLFSQLAGRDPNALIGLPVIALGEIFQRFGVDLLLWANGDSCPPAP